MKTIPLTQGQTTVVDDDVFEGLNRYRWHAQWSENTKTFYAVRQVLEGGKAVQVRMHRVVAGVQGQPRQVQVDHKNHDTLDNRAQNLAVVDSRRNQHNLREKGTDRFSSRFPGVSWHRRLAKWRAVIHIGGIQKSLGCFSTEEEASRAYRVALEALDNGPGAL